MENFVAKEVQKVSVESELKQSYLAYAMSVIVGRALPDVRDGLKPVHRRVLFAMHELGNDWNKPYKKSARIVGDVIGKYHPHGDTAVYDTIVRMAQPFSMRYTLVDGQGNFGSIDGDAAAAMRYTEIRMSRLAHALLADIEKDTVDFTPNYDEHEMMPIVLPTQLPNLLINGSSGIAVGMATNIPPHNLSETVSACIALIDNPELTVMDLMQYIPGPDFPTSGIIYGRNSIIEAYSTGRGRIMVRGRTHIEHDEKGGKERIVVTELPYQVNKARFVERIAELVKDKKIDGITGLRDESAKQGIRVVVDIRRGENTDVILNQLLVHTPLQTVFGINMVALEDGQPKTLTLKQLLNAFIKHRRNVVTRRTIFDLNKTRERAHILEGLAIALSNIDAMIALIKKAKDTNEAKMKLMESTWQISSTVKMMIDATNPSSTNEYRLSAAQAQAILEMRLNRLTNLEQDKIISEYAELQALIIKLLAILESPAQLMKVIRDELIALKEIFGDARRTEMVAVEEGELMIEDLIPDDERVVTLSHDGYVKTQTLDSFKAQHRGGRGKMGAAVKEEDSIDFMIVARAHDHILCFTNFGKVYWLKVYQLPEASRTARGRPIVNLLPLGEGEKVNTFLPVRQFDENHFVVMATSLGLIKKVSLVNFSRPRSSGIMAIQLNDGDYLVQAEIAVDQNDIMLFSDVGKVVRFPGSKVRCMGRQAAGVRGIRLQPDERVVSLIVAHDGDILTVTEKGFGKRTAIDEYRVSGRGGIGIISIQVNDRNGKVIGAIQVKQDAGVMLISNKGMVVRVPVSEISLIGRNTQGVRLIQLSDKEVLVNLERVSGESDACVP
ncbi:MAG: DNA gyrase subunit A [Gammaproteobacteria bacterium RIFCSPHIGHO2_12_FULL_42_10]|nr:MAG: DNA gyrase subunit A [Gammaproteobacteria bacterium RIFCSPHIGHO2_12_FULL_42_10]